MNSIYFFTHFIFPERELIENIVNIFMSRKWRNFSVHETSLNIFFIIFYRHFTIVRNPRLSRESLVKIYWFFFAGNHCRWKVFDSFMFQFTHKIYVIWFPFIEESIACILCAKLWDLGRVRLRSPLMYFVGHFVTNFVTPEPTSSFS